jgi:hypothetical protein
MAFTPDDYYFDPALRAALDAVVDRHLDGRFDPLGLEDFRYIERSLLWAQRHTPAAHWQTLLRLAQSPLGQRALQRQRAMRVMEDYPERAIDLDTGQPLAYMPIALKTYLAQSGQLDAFERALQAAAPHISADFAQVRTLRQYADEHAAKPAAADLVRLKRLSYFLGEGLYSVRKAFLANLPEEERRTLAELEAAPFLPLYADALQATRHPDIPWFVLPEPLTASRLGEPKFDGITYGDRGHRFYTDFVRASMDSAYPPSAERQARYERLKSMTPAQYVNDAHRAFCPAGP